MSLAQDHQGQEGLDVGDQVRNPHLWSNPRHRISPRALHMSSPPRPGPHGIPLNPPATPNLIPSDSTMLGDLDLDLDLDLTLFGKTNLFTSLGQDPALTSQLFPTQSAGTLDIPNSPNSAAAAAVTLTSIHPPVAGWTDGFAAPHDALPHTPYGDQYAGIWGAAPASPQLRFMSAENGGWGMVGDEDDGNDGNDDGDGDGNVARKDFPDAFGTIAMPDAVFVITTRTVLIGRDVQAFKKYKGIHQYQLRVSAALEQGLPPPSPPRAVRRKTQGSYISEEGGILGPEDEEPNPAKRRKITASGDGSEQRHASPDEHKHHERIISRREYLDHTPGAVPVDVSKMRPPENVIARLDIHGRGPDHFATTKGISREHLKIQFNPKRDLWEAHGLGRNGFFCEDKLYQMGQSVPLHSGAQLQIQNIQMEFRLTNVADGKFRPEAAYSENGKSMSFDFVSSQHGQVDTSDSEDGSPKERGSHPAANGDDYDDSDADMDDADAEEPTPDGDDLDEIRETVESDLISDRQKHEGSPDDADQLAQVPFAPKKRGPGRPPKNGVMSKRQERELRKQAQEAAKKNLPPQEPGDAIQKRKVGRPRKHPLPESAEGQAEKRKYKPRKPKGEDGEEEPDGEKPTKERSQKHKTPPLELKREDFTEEQLQKPTKNYQLLIDEIMSAAPEKGYSLKQVYKRIQEKWPFFYFCVDTKGWESSVRHNLLGSECFQKIDGNWHRVAGVPLESGKKRKPSDSAADPRPTGMYNGYTHPYSHSPSGQSHGHQPITHSSGLGQPNLPPRYPPAGQAYQIHQGPNPNNGQANGPPNPQGPPRPGFPVHQAQTPMPTNAYTPAGAPPRPQYPGPQPPAYNPAYGNRTQQPRPVVPGPAGPLAGPNPAQRPPMPKPGSGPPPQHGMPVAHTPSASNMARPSLPPQPQQAMQRTTPAPLAPIILPLLKTFIREFRSELLKQLNAKGEGKRSDAIAMSAINHGLGLTNRSLVPDKQIYEKPILEIFAKHKMTFPQRLAKEMAKSAPVPVAPAATRFPPAAGKTSQPNLPPQATLPPPPPPSITAAPVGVTAPKADGQVDQPGHSNGPVINGNFQGSSAVAALKPASDTAVADPDKAVSVSGTPTTGAKPSSTSASAAPNSIVSPPIAPASTTVGSVPNQTVNRESAAAESLPAPAGIAPSPSASTSGAIPKPSVTGPAATVPAPSSATVPSSAVPSPAGANAGSSSGPTASSVSPSQGSLATHSAANLVAHTSGPATSSTASPIPDSTRPVTNAPATTAPTAPRPASAAPSPGVSATTTNPAPRPATAGSALPVPSAVAPVNAGVPRPSASIATSSAKTPVPGAPRATPTRTGSSATPESVRDVQLLEPKLVELILNFKSTILPTLAGKLNELLSESLIMSAVNRQLGFTDESFVETTTELQKKNFAEAENALMSHLETRFNQYRRERERDRASQR